MLGTRNGNDYEIMIETPAGSRNKYHYDEKKKAFILKKLLPAGSVFPYDFGFIPDTKGEDGDPLDVLVIMDAPSFPGCLISARIIGALKAKQKEKNKTVQNDRLIAISSTSHAYSHIREIIEINKQLKDEIQHFFISYNEMEGRAFIPEGWIGGIEAVQIIEAGK